MYISKMDSYFLDLSLPAKYSARSESIIIFFSAPLTSDFAISKGGFYISDLPSVFLFLFFFSARSVPLTTNPLQTRSLSLLLSASNTHIHTAWALTVP